ncbi:Spore coat protein U (SCPU) domain-containing protein [Sphingopyxis sp. YR583]|uniref:Csu type fimbrial protein n=1 Tax=Sphingopyxis sp. YR583 TaxID=1881047 RepID=UPI0008A76FEC|nr:spore coat U domain-containing protein [Sphingopyxis sp. YR583]SEH12505.1 Spore coat protein U (SCPU) domain-containing protein [Sphingopyxis sp. YR583]
MTDTLEQRRRALAALLVMVASGGGLSFPARAETTADFDVTARIEPGCLVDGLGSAGNAGTIGTLDFGEDSSLSTATHNATTTGSQAIRLRCTPGVSLTMSIDGGTHLASGARHLQRGGDTGSRVAYSLCRDAGCTQPIPVGGTSGVTVTAANANDVRLPVYATLTLPGGRIPGVYSDRLTVTLSW